MTTRGVYFKSCTIKGTVDFIFGCARLLDGVGLEVYGALDGADLKYICSPYGHIGRLGYRDDVLEEGVNLITLRPYLFLGHTLPQETHAWIISIPSTQR